MFNLETSLLGLALAMDAAVASFALGLLGPKPKRALIIAGTFGVFQFLMMWLGSWGGYLFSFSSFGHLFQLVVSILFIGIAIKVLQESFQNEDRVLDWNIEQLFVLALATSLDALAAGISLGTLPMPYLASMEVGVITFSVCLGAYSAALFFKELPTKWLLRAAAAVFLYLGVDNILKHLNIIRQFLENI